MKLVTFQDGEDGERPGIWIEEETKIIDLQSSNLKNGRSLNPSFSSVLRIIEGGDASLAAIKTELDNPHSEAIAKTQDVELCTPIPQPPQIRDCLCFEQHLLQGVAIRLYGIRAILSGPIDLETFASQSGALGLSVMPRPINGAGANQSCMLHQGYDQITCAT